VVVAKLFIACQLDSNWETARCPTSWALEGSDDSKWEHVGLSETLTGTGPGNRMKTWLVNKEGKNFTQWRIRILQPGSLSTSLACANFYDASGNQLWTRHNTIASTSTEGHGEISGFFRPNPTCGPNGATWDGGTTAFGSCLGAKLCLKSWFGFAVKAPTPAAPPEDFEQTKGALSWVDKELRVTAKSGTTWDSRSDGARTRGVVGASTGPVGFEFKYDGPDADLMIGLCYGDTDYTSYKDALVVGFYFQLKNRLSYRVTSAENNPGKNQLVWWESSKFEGMSFPHPSTLPSTIGARYGMYLEAVAKSDSPSKEEMCSQAPCARVRFTKAGAKIHLSPAIPLRAYHVCAMAQPSASGSLSNFKHVGGNGKVAGDW